MSSPVPSIIQDLLNELLQGPDHLLREVETFSSLVDDLRGYSWRLSSHESCFLTRLLRLRSELVDKIALVFSIEDAERRHRQTMSKTFDQIWSAEDVQMGEFIVDGGVTVQTAGPPPAVVGIGSSVWGSTFDPAAFVENTLLGAGDSARFDSLTTAELRNLALSYEVKGTVLTHLLSARRDKEIQEANSKVTRAKQAVSDAERTIAEIKKQWVDEVDRLKRTHREALAEMRGAHGREIAELRKKHADEKASLRAKAAILEAEVTTLEVLRNNLIVSLTQSRKDISELEEDVDELEETNIALKQSMADKYVDGFWSSIEQVKILFPELDPDVLAQVDVMKRIKDGKLI
ncbi:hypothetical protein TSUD_161880 [Trifolium subterraneum]|uniref:Uncharacterized protein n=1 Tax=Trifolium subterraneum TaxID=3900 RepID=A0A2Z6MIY0_TRISU|nr:hypothetical protein TSUD_161880 [Trifolium subterraneum]